jgi:hypothetical protein
VEELRRAEKEKEEKKAVVAAPKANPKSIAREGSVKGKPMDEAKASQKEKLQSALAEKKPVKKVGKLQKEGGGKIPARKKELERESV